MIAKNHYDDCPYGCNVNGKLLDVETRQLIPCPHCSQKKKELLRQGYVESENDEIVPLSNVLGIENEYLSTKFVYDVVIPDEEKLFIEEDSLQWQRDVADDLYLGLTTGLLPESSLCFGIGIKGKAERFAYPMLAKAYLAGLSISKFMTCTEYNRISVNQSIDISNFFESDVCMMLINEGCTIGDLSSAKGLMQIRSLKGKPTIFISTWTVEACSTLLDYITDNSFSLAKPIFVKYKSSGNKKQSSYINKILGVENKQAGGNDNTMSLADL